MGTTVSRACRDPFGYGNNGWEKKAAKFAVINNDLSGQTIAITGGNSGIGLATAKRLASLGANIIIFGRDKAKLESAVSQIGPKARAIPLDMTDFNSIVALNLPPVDVLVHNAGDMLEEKRTVAWPAGPVDQSFALLVAGPYLLSKVLKSSYTIWVSSGGMFTKKLNVNETLNPPDEPFDGMVQYARCKRASVVAARRLGHQSMHPGWVDTEAVQKRMPKFYEKQKDVLRTTDQGADTIVYLAATKPSEVAFWFDRKHNSEFPVPFTTHKPEEENKLLAELERLTFIPNKQ